MNNVDNSVPNELMYAWEHEGGDEEWQPRQKEFDNELSIENLHDGVASIDNRFGGHSNPSNPNPTPSLKDGKGALSTNHDQMVKEDMMREQEAILENEGLSGANSNSDDEFLPSMIDLFIQAVESDDKSFSETDLQKINNYIDTNPDKLSDEQTLALAGVNMDDFQETSRRSDSKTTESIENIQTDSVLDDKLAQDSKMDVEPKPIWGFPAPKPPGF